MADKFILGIHGRGDAFGAGNASAALLKNGEIIAFAEQERWNHKKHTGEFPREAIDFCLTEAGITLDQIDEIAWPWALSRYPSRAVAAGFAEGGVLGAASALKNLKLGWTAGHLARDAHLGRRLGKKFHKVAHHDAHAASAFFPSPFESAAVLVIDGYGEYDSTTIYRGRGNRLEPIFRLPLPHSLGGLWNLLTRHLGFLPYCDEGKVMGLSPYGDGADFHAAFDELFSFDKNGVYRLDGKKLGWTPGGFHFRETAWLREKFGPARKKSDPLEHRHENIAAALQDATNDAILRLAKFALKKTGEKNLCLAGGVALNSVANGKILEADLAENLWVQPAADDAGTALGAALWRHHQVHGAPRNFVQTHAYFGPDFGADAIEKELRLTRWPFKKLENAPATAAKLLADGKIIGWFQGKMEVGPRALGNRSILADPRRAEMKDRVNAEVKHREPFRPFAPSILREKVADYFDRDEDVPFMLKVLTIRPEKRAEIPAVTHVDGTGRVQTVARDANPRYHALISEFEKITGVPIVLNTSFNIMGETIVRTPLDALKCFFTTGLDALVLGDFLIEKPGKSAE